MNALALKIRWQIDFLQYTRIKRGVAKFQNKLHLRAVIRHIVHIFDSPSSSHL